MYENKTFIEKWDISLLKPGGTTSDNQIHFSAKIGYEDTTDENLMLTVNKEQ